MDGTKSPTLFTLDACCVPIPCEDPQVHAEWMADTANSTIRETEIPKSRRVVRTVFLGTNHGTDEDPMFFDVRIEPLAARVNVIL